MATERNVVDFKIHNLTEEQFQELKAQGKIDPNAMYCTPDETVVNFGAVNTRIEEINDRIDETNNAVNTRIDETNNTLNTRIEEINDRIDETNNAVNTRIDETNNALNDRIDVVGSEIESLKDKGGMPVLTPMWFDHISNDMSWLRADTFSWQSGDVYKAVYEHLVADCENAQTTTYYAWTGEGYILGTQDTVYTTSQTPAVGDAVYLYSDGDISALAVGTITSSSSASIAYKSAVDGTTRSAFAYSGEVQLPVHMETIAGVTITYCLSQDGHKICTSGDESKVVAIYEATGVAWYYLLDTVNKQFKLPRTKWGFTGLRDSVGGYVEAGLPNITAAWANHGSSAYANGAVTVTTRSWGNRDAANDQNSGAYKLDASRSSSIYGASDTVQPPATQMYLYFYVGNFEQTAIEQTAGINAELFNNKADVGFGNVSNAAKELMANASMPSDTYIDLTLGASGSTYTAPADGWFAVNKVSSGTNQYAKLAVGDNKIVIEVRGPTNGTLCACYIPVKAGDVVTCTYTAAGATNFFRFIYAEGAKHLA